MQYKYWSTFPITYDYNVHINPWYSYRLFHYLAACTIYFKSIWVLAFGVWICWSNYFNTFFLVLSPGVLLSDPSFMTPSPLVIFSQIPAVVLVTVREEAPYCCEFEDILICIVISVQSWLVSQTKQIKKAFKLSDFLWETVICLNSQSAFYLAKNPFL